MAVTMIDPIQVMKTPFSDSHLLQKLNKFVCVLRVVGNNFADHSYIHAVHEVDLDVETKKIIEEDYETIRAQISQKGLKSLSGKMGKLIQPRTKGAGHGSISRAFYARKEFLKRVMPI
ncbi:hypothetical protein LPB140_09650 [Sphingorhabdus lutea]|uniref:DNA mismatch repair MutH/Type II restriction enzyme Sau3AI domain-containing protein n=2 Tax=Sphingorhabdus lutea TaxID=1913578 RepID=A0A1L3JF41_9SPHN|nr:hypothetical protein LPB140_09650 [Sphingorhabdus lutea]